MTKRAKKRLRVQAPSDNQGRVDRVEIINRRIRERRRRSSGGKNQFSRVDQETNNLEMVISELRQELDY